MITARPAPPIFNVPISRLDISEDAINLVNARFGITDEINR
jgi:hypothetical protein